MQPTARQKIENFESAILACFGSELEDTLPQVAGEEEMIVELIQEISFRPHDLISVELHNQIDPTYQ